MPEHLAEPLLGSGFSDFDPAKAIANFAEFPEIFPSVVSLFRESYPTDLQALRVALRENDAVKTAFLVHKIKGSAGCFNADQAVALAEEVERRAGRGNLPELLPSIEQLETALAYVLSVLEQTVKELAGTHDLPLGEASRERK